MSISARLANGAIIGVLLTSTLIAVLYVGWTLAGLPFVPFDRFDWIGREVPGAVVTFTSDSVVAAARALQVATIDAAAKTAEQTLAVVTALTAGAGLGAVLLAVLGWSDEPPTSLG